MVVTLVSAPGYALASDFKVYTIVFYAVGNAPSGELFCMPTGLVFSVC